MQVTDEWVMLEIDEDLIGWLLMVLTIEKRWMMVRVEAGSVALALELDGR